MASFWTLTSKDADQFKKGMKKRTDMPMHTMVFANIMQISKMPDRHLKYQLHAVVINTITYLFLPFYFCIFPRFCH